MHKMRVPLFSTRHLQYRDAYTTHRSPLPRCTLFAISPRPAPPQFPLDNDDVCGVHAPPVNSSPRLGSLVDESTAAHDGPSTTVVACDFLANPNLENISNKVSNPFPSFFFSILCIFPNTIDSPFGHDDGPAGRRRERPGKMGRGGSPRSARGGRKLLRGGGPVARQGAPANGRRRPVHVRPHVRHVDASQEVPFCGQSWCWCCYCSFSLVPMGLDEISLNPLRDNHVLSLALFPSC